MNNTIQIASDEATGIFVATETALNEWSGVGCLQFPSLLGTVAVKLNWNEKQLREGDAIVRFYVRRHPEWHVTRGAHGGIMRVSDRAKKESEKLAKQQERAKAKAAIEAKLGIADVVPADNTQATE